jgi:hypothetical protein
MNGMEDYLKKVAGKLDMGRAGQLVEIQSYLDGLYPGQCRAISINKGVLKITTPNASVASELRYKHRQIAEMFGIESVTTQIR